MTERITFDAQEIQRQRGGSLRTARRWLREGHVRSFKSGNRLLCLAADYATWAQKQASKNR